MGTLYYLVVEDRKEVLSVGKQYWLRLVLDQIVTPADILAAWDLYVEGARTDRTSHYYAWLPESLQAARSFVLCICRWVEERGGHARVVTEHTYDVPPWEDEDLNLQPGWSAWDAQNAPHYAPWKGYGDSMNNSERA